MIRKFNIYVLMKVKYKYLTCSIVHVACFVVLYGVNISAIITKTFYSNMTMFISSF